MTRCVWAVSLRHQLDGRSKECAHACAHVAASVCVRARMHRRGSSIVFHWSRWPRKDGRLRGETRRGEARRGEVRRGEVGKRQKRRGRPTRARTHTHTRVHTRPPRVLGPRQLTSDGRKSFYVFILRATDPFYPPSTSPRSSPRFHGGWDRSERFEDYRVSCEAARINILEPIRGNRGANLMAKRIDNPLYL